MLAVRFRLITSPTFAVDLLAENVQVAGFIIWANVAMGSNSHATSARNGFIPLWVSVDLKGEQNYYKNISI
jgi:hypothetical protein